MRGLLVIATVSACTGFTPRDVEPDGLTDGAGDTGDGSPGIPFPLDHAKVTTAAGATFEIGRSENTFPWKGQLDEVHIYDDLMTPERIQTNFANQSSPATFSSIGPEETAP